MGEFLAMGGHAGFIWPAYAIAAVVLGAAVGLSLRRLRRLEAALRADQRRTP